MLTRTILTYRTTVKHRAQEPNRLILFPNCLFLPEEVGYMVSTSARPTTAFSGHALREHRKSSPCLIYSIYLFKRSSQIVLYCAHRTSTVSPCAFCEQEGHLAAPLLTAATREAIWLRIPSASRLADHRSGLVYVDNDEDPIAGRN